MSSTRRWTLVVSLTMALGAMGLAPPVVSYWGARCGGGALDSTPQTAARTLRPKSPALEVDEQRLHIASEQALRAGQRGSLRASANGAASTTERDRDEHEPELEPSTEAEATPSSGGSATAAADMEAEPAHVHTPAAPAPAAQPEIGTLGATDDFDDSRGLEEAPGPPETRRVALSVLETRTQPGLCNGSSEAADAHAALVARFNAVSWDGSAQLFLDPRLGPGAHRSLASELVRAESELWRVLRLAPARPDAFGYFDTELLLAAACTNDDVVAYYDGALHVVLARDDVEQSVLHEYTHHALMTAGLLGPAWAQEGIAMHVAGEVWWKSGWLSRLLERPFSLEVMESAVPYKLRSDQAALFYAQSAAMVACAIQDDPRGLAGLVAALAAGNDQGELSYALPASASPAAWRTCFADLAR